jgi:hypothetical protein
MNGSAPERVSFGERRLDQPLRTTPAGRRRRETPPGSRPIDAENAGPARAPRRPGVWSPAQNPVRGEDGPWYISVSIAPVEKRSLLRPSSSRLYPPVVALTTVHGPMPYVNRGCTTRNNSQHASIVPGRWRMPRLHILLPAFSLGQDTPDGCGRPGALCARPARGSGKIQNPDTHRASRPARCRRLDCS